MSSSITHDTPNSKTVALDFASLAGAELTAALLRSDAFAIAALGVCGVDISSTEAKFASPYSHTGKDETAHLLKGKADGRYLLRFWRPRPDDDAEGYSVIISQLYRDYISGCLHDIRNGSDNPRRRKVGKVEGATWIIRLAAEAGLIKLPQVESQPLGANAPRGVRLVYKASVKLSQCRLRYDPTNTTFPAAQRFLVDWAGGIPELDALSGKRWLVTHGYWRVETPGQQYQAGKAGGVPTLYRFGGSTDVRKCRRAAERKSDAPLGADSSSVQVPGRTGLPDNQDGELYKHLPDTLEEWQRQNPAGGEE